MHNGHIFGYTNLNLRYAMRRLTSVRKPETPLLHAQLKKQQAQFVTAHLDEIDALYFSKCREEFGDYKGMEEECRLHHDDPHPKKALRIQAYRELLETGLIHKRLWLTSVKYKMKKDEWAKILKYARMIGDLGVAASLQGFRLTKFMKLTQTHSFKLFGGVAQFISTPKASVLHEVFEKMYNPPGAFYFAMFSDDSILAVRDKGVVRWYNLDISGCDSSHGPTIFSALLNIVPNQFRDDLLRLVEQCELPIIVSSSDGKHKIKLKPAHATLYSGSTLTTTINNWANFLIIYSIARGGDFSPAGISASAKRCGYIVTVEVCDCFEDVQFLKNSPVKDAAGTYRPVVNLGILLRSTGVCRGDLPGRRKVPLKERARIFQSALLQGMYPRVHFNLLDNMKRTAGSVDTAVADQIREKHFKYKIELDDSYPIFSVRDEDLYRRYRLSDFEIEQLNSELGSATFGDHLSC